MLSINKIKKAFAEKLILKDITFQAKEGELTIIEGKNGAGKSTLFAIIAGQIMADEGSIKLKDLDLVKIPAIKRAKFLSILHQDPNASSISSFSIKDNLILASLKSRRASLKSISTDEYEKMVKSHLEDLGLSDFIHDTHRSMSDLSGGQRQILSFAMATLDRPEFLLLDEPTAALDEKSSHFLMKLIKRLITLWNIPAVMISHDHALNREHGDSFLTLIEGKIE